MFDENSFVPAAKLVGDKSYSILTDHLGTPYEAYDENGEKVWSAEYDLYGNIHTLEGEKGFIPFRYQGQYEDVETGLYYNRFRYYSPESGTYISQDPIRLAGGLAFYGYVMDCNGWIDPWGLNIFDYTSPYQTRYNPEFPYRPDPQFSIDTSIFPNGTPTANGGIRNNIKFWEEWEKLNPESLSENNRWKIGHGFSPIIDDIWIEFFPEHSEYKGEKLIHHHVDQGIYAIPVPEPTHNGPGGVWHCKNKI